MTKYDIIYESLVEKVNNEELTLEEAQELNKLAFEKYRDTEIEDNDSVTLEEAMEIIGGYLMEAKSDSPDLKAKKKYIKDYYKKNMDTPDYRGDSSIKKKIEYNADDEKDKVLYKLDKKLSDIDKKPHKIDTNKRTFDNFIDKDGKKEKEAKKLHETDRANRDIDNIYAKANMLNKFNRKGKVRLPNQWDTFDDPNHKDDADFVVKGKNKNVFVHSKSVKESVDELRLQVYEAFESGLIEESTKDLFLDYLNLENYE